MAPRHPALARLAPGEGRLTLGPELPLDNDWSPPPRQAGEPYARPAAPTAFRTSPITRARPGFAGLRVRDVPLFDPVRFGDAGTVFETFTHLGHRRRHRARRPRHRGRRPAAARTAARRQGHRHRRRALRRPDAARPGRRRLSRRVPAPRTGLRGPRRRLPRGSEHPARRRAPRPAGTARGRARLGLPAGRPAEAGAAAGIPIAVAGGANSPGRSRR